MPDAFAWLALALLALGVVGSVLPVLPGALLSLGGVFLYWWSTGYADPSPLVLAALTAVGLLAAVADFVAGAVSARAGGAAWSTSALGVLVGTALFFVAGPVGLVAGVAGVVFLAEYRRHGDPGASARTALYATVGVFASAAVQAFLTLAILVAMAFVVFT